MPFPAALGKMNATEKTTMTTVTLEEARAALADLVHGLSAGEEIVITEHDRPVARLVLEGGTTPKPIRQLGTMKGSVLGMTPDFDAPLDDFAEYME
jgi:antitoxin (DNA-binding transcriptional repressor) of toxin-antitoxin stability system